jgi:flagellar protein FliO/FliZ
MQTQSPFLAVLALAAVLGAILLAGRLARPLLAVRAARGGAAGPRLVASLALDGRRRLHLAELEGGRVLVLTGGGADCLLPWPAPAGSAGRE